MSFNARFAAVGLTLTFSLAASAEPAAENRWSASLRLGPARMQDSITGFPNQDRPPYEFGYDGGIAWSLAGGFRFNPHVRVELEMTGRDHALATSTPAGSDADGRLAVRALMANAYWDFASHGAWQPYLGVGVGVAGIGLDGYRVNGAPLVDDRERATAFQAIAGVRYRIDEHWHLSADYRYFRTSDPLMNSVAGDVMETSIRSHAIMLGVTRAFGR